MKKLLVVVALASAFFGAIARAQTIDQTHRIVKDVRIYADGSLLVRVSPGMTSSGCQWSDHLHMASNSPAIKATTALALVAYTTRRKIQVIWNNACAGNVLFTGIVLPEQ